MVKEFVCTKCGYSGKPKKVAKGSILVEIVLWCCLFVPGFCYSVWRMISKYNACPNCKGDSMIPADSPMGQKLIKDLSK